MLAACCGNSPVQIICELVSVIRVGTVGYDSPCPFDRRKTAQVCNTLLCTEHIHIVLRVIHMGKKIVRYPARAKSPEPPIPFMRRLPQICVELT